MIFNKNSIQRSYIYTEVSDTMKRLTCYNINYYTYYNDYNTFEIENVFSRGIQKKKKEKKTFLRQPFYFFFRRCVDSHGVFFFFWKKHRFTF